MGSPREIIDLLALQRRNEASTQSILGAAQECSNQLASAVAGEMRSLIRSLISRIVVHTARVDIQLDRQGLQIALLGTGSPKSPKVAIHNGFLTLKLKARLKRCGREVRLMLPVSSGEETPVYLTQSLIKAVARAHDWYRRIIRGELTGSRSIANATGLDERYVNRILQFAFLAPDIVESILDGRQPANMTLENFRTHLPTMWETQRQRLGFPDR